MNPKITIQGNEAKVKFSGSILIKAENVEEFERKIKDLIEEFALK